ncbi:MAG: DUF5717 family protein, partial [Lachnospiraceae bacterium]|nr:DUF5717 family protein [Lachnospiraceae bacterium]
SSVVRNLYEIVDKLKEGLFEYEREKLTFSVHKIEADVPVDGIYEGSLKIESSNDEEKSRVEGSIFSSSMRLQCADEEFLEAPFELSYVFNPKGLEVGSIIKGDIQIVSNVGEYYIPFVFTIVKNVSKTAYGKVKNLFHFSNSAQMDWKEAVRLFYSEDFKYVLEGNDRIHYDKYRGYNRIKGNEQNVELFLRSIKKKQRIDYRSERTAYEFTDVTSDLKCEISVKKSTWGYVGLTISSDSDFIEIEKENVTIDDFLGNIFNLTFYIREEKLHAGKNYGRISMKTGSRIELEFFITASYRDNSKEKRLKKRELDGLKLLLVKKYISFRTKQINSGVWIRESMEIVEKMNSLDSKNPLSRLFQVQLLLAEGRATESKWILDHVGAEMKISDKSDEIYCYYRYLCALYSRKEEFVNEVCGEIRRIYEHKCKSPFILWILLYLDEELSVSGKKRMVKLTEQFKEGCSSPILYIEAYNYYTANPAVLEKLTEIEIRIIYFALKNFKIDRELLERVTELADSLKQFSDAVVTILEKAYDLTKDEKIVETLCTLLIKNNKTEERFFKWYSLGVENDINITRLYEYYMYSIPFDYDSMIQKPVIMYFGYSNDLGYEKMAMLYANLIDHKAQNPSLYEANREKMRIFAIEQILQEHMNRELARIYEDVIYVQLINPDIAKHFVRILFAYEIAVMDKEMANVVIIEEALKGEKIYPIERGYSYPVIYTRDFTAFLEDKKGNRFIIENKYFRRVMEDALFLRAIQNYIKGNPGFALYICNLRHRYVVIDHDNIDFCRELVESDEVIESYKESIRVGLLKYYYENNMYPLLDEYIKKLDPSGLDGRSRSELIEYMVKRGMYEKAYEYVLAYGSEEIPSKVCVRICSHMIALKDEGSDRALIKFAYYCFTNGKYDLLTLKYLIDNYEGLTKELRNLWKAASQMMVECQNLRERLLIQMMYTRTSIGEKEELFEEYVGAGSRLNIEMAYLSYQSYEYFARLRLAGDRAFYHIERNYRNGEKLNDACKLAVLKYYAEEGRNKKDSNKEMLKEFLLGYIRRNWYYDFFRAYRAIVPELMTYDDKTIIEYRTDPGHKVYLHYLIEQTDRDKEHYVTEEMTPLFGGVFSREFILFFGENLQYYIMDEGPDGEKRLTHSDSVSLSETNYAESTSRYTMINDMAVANTLQDDNTVLNLMEEYVEIDSFTERAFNIL